MGSSHESREIPRRLLVAGIIVWEGKILLVHNIKHGLRMEPPGGKVESGESPEVALKREILEELGLEVDVGEFLGVYHTLSPEGEFPVHTYMCAIKSGEPMVNREPGKIGHFEWFTTDELSAACEKARKDGSHLVVPNLQEALGDILKRMKRA